jgi:hypothetical protein
MSLHYSFTHKVVSLHNINRTMLSIRLPKAWKSAYDQIGRHKEQEHSGKMAIDNNAMLLFASFIQINTSECGLQILMCRDGDKNSVTCISFHTYVFPPFCNGYMAVQAFIRMSRIRNGY